MLKSLIYRKFFDQIPDFLVVINRDYRVEMCNWRGAYQYVPEERRRLGMRCYEIFYPGQDRPCVPCHVDEVFRTGEPLVREKFNPAVGHVEVRCFPVFDRQGKVMMVAEQIKQAGDRAAALTGRLLTFSRRQVSHPEELDLNVVLEGLTAMLKGLVGDRIELVVLPGRDLGHVRADLDQVEQVIMNLAVNARDAMHDGGRLTMALSSVRLDSPKACSPVELKPGDFVMLSVGDTGQGIAPEVLPSIFEPFFTTKEKGKGTGLGLSLVYGIVTKSGGCVEVESVPGQGTTFRVYLPRITSDACSEQ